MPLSADQLDVIRALDDESRYEFFISTVVTERKIWSLDSPQGWVVMNSDGEECLPIWPLEDLAAEAVSGDWSDCTPKAITLDQWLRRWTPGMEKDGTLLAVFPNDADESIVVKPGELAQALNEELKRQ